MMRAIAAVLLFAAVGAAQVRGPAEVSVSVGRLASVPLTVDGEEIQYAVLGGEVFGGFREFSDPKEFRFQVLGYQPGVGYIVVGTTKAGKLQPLFTVKVTVTGVGPVPPPPGPTPGPDPPPPGPTPPPAPLTKSKLVAVFIEETAEAVPARAGLFLSAEVNAFMTSKGHKWRIVDKDVLGPDGKPPADVVRFLDDAKLNKIPRVYLVDEKGKTRYAGVIPGTTAGFIDLMKKYQGGE